MRVTNSMVVNSTLRDLNLSLSRLQDTQTDLTTGRKIRRGSDDPTGASAAMTIRNQLRRAEHEARSLDDAQAWLSSADTALVTGLEVLGAVKETAIRAGNTGSGNALSREALAKSVENMRSDLLTLANTKYLGRPIFNGTAAPNADGNAYDAAGVYGGNGAAVSREIAPNTTVAVNMTGEEIFGVQGAPFGNVFDVLEELASAIRANDTTRMATAQTELETATTRWSASTAEIGSRGARVEQTAFRAADTDLMLRETLSKLEDVDIAAALMSVKANENAYTAALTAAAKVIPPSLVDYLR
jgi:flagellar hook-associated protein 3 FlgL